MGLLLPSGGWGPGTLLSILPCTGQECQGAALSSSILELPLNRKGEVRISFRAYGRKTLHLSSLVPFLVWHISLKSLPSSTSLASLPDPQLPTLYRSLSGLPFGAVDPPHAAPLFWMNLVAGPCWGVGARKGYRQEEKRVRREETGRRGRGSDKEGRSDGKGRDTQRKEASEKKGGERRSGGGRRREGRPEFHLFNQRVQPCNCAVIDTL